MKFKTIGELRDALQELAEAAGDVEVAMKSLRCGDCEKTMRAKQQVLEVRHQRLAELRDEEL